MKHLTGKEEIDAFVDRYDTFLFDCDGVLWSGSRQIGQSAKAIAKLHALGKTVVFVTNNSTKSREEYRRSMAKLGIETDVDHIFCSAYATAFYLAEKYTPGTNIYVIGMNGVREELANVGLTCVNGPNDEDDARAMVSTADMETVVPRDDIAAVVVGFDININYRKYAKAFTYVHSGGAEFYGTNDDATFPSAGRIYPGTGSFLASLAKSLGREPIVLGKPHQPMLDVIVDKFHLDRARTCMVGDRLDTDIAFAAHGGVDSLLVLSGVTKRETVSPENADNLAVKPVYIMEQLDRILTEEESAE